ncbi:WecB/TagA/CpsF family glycosyltransferase [Zobellia nedashkovskayae]|uniref:WecB/TagA/CpsF family glycosyltransferase n=1 Tax=Zobellia nedashkovskayae TaxID=2779510 RepID=UPI001D048910|nr:WecB/TagA/CpsF family glycosyltransferase [Zobellia nedashkovskayae]
MSRYKNIECMGYPIFSDSLESITFEKNFLISTINQYSYCIAEEDAEFKNALKNSDILLPDGIGIVLASKWLYHQKVKKIAGADIHQFLLEKLNKESGSCFYLGASESTLAIITKRMAKDYPNVKVGSYSPPFKAEFSEADNQKMIESVNNFVPDVLFVGMTAPKQEKWAYTHKNDMTVGMICSIGAVFDFYAGTVKRPSKIWIDLGLEWLGRLLREPGRMWKRYIYYGAIFVYYLAKEKVALLLKKTVPVES